MWRKVVLKLISAIITTAATAATGTIVRWLLIRRFRKKYPEQVLLLEPYDETSVHMGEYARPRSSATQNIPEGIHGPTIRRGTEE